MTALSKEFYKQLNSIENFNQLDYNDPKVVAVRMRADHELAAMELARESKIIPKPEVIKKEFFIYEFHRGNEIIATGTAIEIAEKLGMKEQSVRQMSTPSFHKQINKNRARYAEKVGLNK